MRCLLVFHHLKEVSWDLSEVSVSNPLASHLWAHAKAECGDRSTWWNRAADLIEAMKDTEKKVTKGQNTALKAMSPKPTSSNYMLYPKVFTTS